VVAVRPAPAGGVLVTASERAHVLVCSLDEINLLANPGRGVTVLRLDDDDRVVGFSVNEPLVLESDKGKTEQVRALKKDMVARGGKGAQLWRKDKVARVVVEAPSVPQLVEAAPNGEGST
jgi:DNA gyrase subunit A